MSCRFVVLLLASAFLTSALPAAVRAEGPSGGSAPLPPQSPTAPSAGAVLQPPAIQPEQKPSAAPPATAAEALPSEAAASSQVDPARAADTATTSAAVAAPIPSPQATPSATPDAAAPESDAEPAPPAALASAPASDPAADYSASASATRPQAAEYLPYGTGSRVNAPLEQLPSSISLVDQRSLQERGVVNLEQGLEFVPGIAAVWTYGGFLQMTLRGFQAISLVDGMRDTRPMVAGSAPQGAMFDVERLEVLRGPSSVLYGYGAVGGVVNLIRKRPSRTPRLELDLGLGLPDQKLISASARGPAGELLSYHVDVGHVQRTDHRGAATERNQVSAALEIRPARQHTVGLRVSYGFDHYTTDVGIPTVEDPDEPGTWRLPPGAHVENNYGTRNDHLDYERLELSADYRFDLARETYLQARVNLVDDFYDYQAAETLTYEPAMGVTPAQVSREYLHFARSWNPFVGQLELHTELETGPLRHALVFGYEFNAFLGVSDRGDDGSAVPGSVSFAHPADDAPPTGALQRTSQDHYRHITHSLYALDHMHVFEDLSATGGVRFDALQSRVLREFLDRETGEETDDPETGERRSPVRDSLVGLTGQVGLVYTPWAPLTVYAGYSSGWKPVFVYPSDVEATNWDPERSHQLEAGVRVRVENAGHALTLDGAAYQIEKRNMLISRGDDDYEQAGEVQSRGVDLALGYRAARWFEVDVSYAYTHAEFEQYISPDPVTGDNQSLAGRAPGFTPTHSGSAWLRLSFTESLGIGIGGRFAAEQYADDENRVPLPDYALLDLSAWIRGEHASFSISARNLLDHRDYFASSINSWALNPQVTPGPGREILASLRLMH